MNVLKELIDYRSNIRNYKQVVTIVSSESEALSQSIGDMVYCDENLYYVSKTGNKKILIEVMS